MDQVSWLHIWLTSLLSNAIHRLATFYRYSFFDIMLWNGGRFNGSMIVEGRKIFDSDTIDSNNICEIYIKNRHQGNKYLVGGLLKKSSDQIFFEYISEFTVQNCTYMKGVHHRVNIYSRKNPPVTISIVSYKYKFNN